MGSGGRGGEFVFVSFIGGGAPPVWVFLTKSVALPQPLCFAALQHV
ncbi:MAG: hypothetical protein DSM106950_13235 [Stigonema ocellatum SAG 48.90 = DSM 106950]|nr:hypothetical protein [Stigonema ocellatum SAG 48.90 = DSM 106950]